ncbi:MAG: helix-turn-helix domain-containing protein [Lachnospiraceae bacterium]|nr:helix-turn-helix domain-containing protein [Lachnospiraceae bacterium]
MSREEIKYLVDNLFLYNGQGRQIREYRMSLGLKKKPFADMLHVDVSSLRTWESDQKRMTKQTWERCFKDRV